MWWYIWRFGYTKDVGLDQESCTFKCPTHFHTLPTIGNSTSCSGTCRSECPSQVFIILQWLLTSAIPLIPQDTPKITLAYYDNICNLSATATAQTIRWILRKSMYFISPIIHKRKYNPDKIKSENPSFNTQAGEKTFVWVGRFKHIVCAMNKTHHLFHLHHMVRRNAYTVKCYKNGRKPIPPKKDIKSSCECLPLLGKGGYVGALCLLVSVLFLW